jgi:hemerythrin-like domain-containing protein
MATLTAAFQSGSKRVHYEHGVLVQQLRALDLELDYLQGHLETAGSLIAAKRIQLYASQLADELPSHFLREEQTVLASVAGVSRQLELFAEEMKAQHRDLRQRLNLFCQAIDQLETAEDLAAAVGEIREKGKALTGELGRHIALEEQELSGFL